MVLSCGSVFQSLRGAVTWDYDLQNNLCSDTQSLSMDAGISVFRKPLLLLTAPISGRDRHARGMGRSGSFSQKSRPLL